MSKYAPIAGSLRRRRSSTAHRLVMESLEQRQMFSADGNAFGHMLKSGENTLQTSVRHIDRSLTLAQESAEFAEPQFATTPTRNNLKSVNLTTVPAAPSSLVATPVSATQVRLTWADRSTNETGFKVERSRGTTGVWTQIAMVATNVATYTDSGLMGGATYQYRVRATNPAGDSAYAPAATATTPLLTAPAAPSGLTATSTSTTEMVLGWVDNATSETSYDVERSAAGSNAWTRVATLPANTASYGDSGLNPGTAYDYRVRAVNAAGASAYASTQQMTRAFPLSQIRVSDATATMDGFKVHEVILSRAGDTSGTKTTVYTQRVSATQLDATNHLHTYRTPNGEVTVQAMISGTGNDKTMKATVTAGAGWTVHQIVLGAPWVWPPLTGADLKVFHTFKGGVTMPWKLGGYDTQGATLWPNNDYSPLAVFYDANTTEGVGMVSFDDGLEQRQLFWVMAPDVLMPFVRWDCNLTNGQSQETTLNLHKSFNMPNEQFSYYRSNFLVPFMNSQGIPEATVPLRQVMAFSGGADTGHVAPNAAKAVSLGTNAYLQYAPGDGGPYYEPNPQTLWWYSTLQDAAKVPGLDVLGVLIDPFMKSRTTAPTTDPTSPLWYPSGGGPQTLSDPNNQVFMERLKNDLVAKGVNFAFWDMGGAPPAGEGRLWFNLLRSWKEAGISIAPESSSDVASYLTGTNLFYNYNLENSYDIVRTVTPQAKILWLQDNNTPVNGVYWWQRASSLGFVPLLDEHQMPIWSAQRAL